MPFLPLSPLAASAALPFVVFLRLFADGAEVGGLLAVVQVTAVAADPDGLAVFGEDLAAVDLFNEGAVALFVLLLLCAFASKFGIVKLVSTGYTILGYVNLPILILPALFLAGRKIKKSYLQEHNIDMTGVNE
mgnify:CR=1 FL=1